MTRKDYIAIGEILRDYRDSIPKNAWTHLVKDFSRLFKMDNTRFKRDKFEEKVNGGA